MSVDVREEQRTSNGKAPSEPSEATSEPRPTLTARFRTALAQIDWKITLLTALAMAVGWCGLFLANNWLQILAGIVPVLAGLYLGRRVQSQWLLHGIMLGITGFVFGFIFIVAYGAMGQAGIVSLPSVALEVDQPAAELTFSQLITFYGTFSIFALIPFPAFGAMMAGRNEQRSREMKRQIEARGGRLERPGSVRTFEDVRGLSLPQFGTYVSNLFKKKGFDVVDYQFIDKDKHLDFELAYQQETYLLRLSVADKVRTGTVESLAQEMKRRNIPKGLVITSTEFAPDALKSAKSRKNIVAVDGETLFGMAENN